MIVECTKCGFQQTAYGFDLIGATTYCEECGEEFEIEREVKYKDSELYKIQEDNFSRK